MKTHFLFFIVFILSQTTYSQIGINTTLPSAMLDVSSATNGVLFSRIALTANNVTAPVVNPQGGALPISTLIYNTATVTGANGVVPGYYYWNGILWIPFSNPISNDWKINGNVSTNDPTIPLTYGISIIGATENFVGTTDANDVVVGTNTIERIRVKQTSGNIGIGTANPLNKLHIETSIPAVATVFSENTFIGNSNGIGLEGKSINNPAFGIGGKFTGNAYGIQAINNGSSGATTYGGDFTSTGLASTGNRYGINAEADGGSINIGGALIGFGSTATENFGGFFTAFNGLKNVGSQSQANGPANSLNGGVFATAVGGTNSTNYGGNFNAQTTTAVGTINYGGFFAASGGNRNYGIVVPNGGGIVGFGTITPNAMLDVSAATNGVLFPRIALTANNIAAPVVNPQGGALPTSTLIYNTATIAGINGVAPGYYYWNGTLWTPIGGSVSNDWKLIGNTTTIEPADPITYGTSTIAANENFIGTTDANDIVIGTNNVERFRVKKTSGNIGIGISNPVNKLHITTTNAGFTTSLSENTFIGNTSGIGIIGSSVNNPGFGIGGQFFGGSVGLESFANASTYSGTAVGIRGISSGNGGAFAYRVGGIFESSGTNGNNYGGQFSANGGTNNYGANFQTFGASTRNYGANFSASGGTTGNWAGVFNSTGGATATGADFIANNGTSQTTAGYFQAIGASINYGTRAIVSNGVINYGGSFVTNGTATSTNYSGYFASFGGFNNHAGLFLATGGTNNYAIIVPSGGGDVGIGNSTPLFRLHVTDSSTNNATAYVENNTNFSGIGVEGRASGINNGIGGRFTGSGIGVSGVGISVLGGTSPKGGAFSATTLATTNYGITADASGGVSSNYAGYFTATGNTTTNVGGFFSATGAPFNNYAIIVPANEGRVGIGTSAPVDQLEVAGGFVRSTGYRCRTGTLGTYPGNVYNINWTGTAGQLWIDTFNVGTFQFTSDRRLKENIIPINNTAISRVMLLNPVSFKYKNIPETIFTGSDEVIEGFIADELQEIIPSAVNGEKDGLTKEGKIQPQTLNMAPVVSVLTKAIQEQQLMIKELLLKNYQLETRLKTLENK
ncbi:beta strand repeat-containing protein [Flavobacterium sp.]|uniref:beta strand repeat-containing protein n=1 Tax=Flavobacterium sp. TaxID=239 RepID=UPI003750F47C